MQPDAFEDQLAMALRRRAASGPVTVDASAVAHAIAIDPQASAMRGRSSRWVLSWDGVFGRRNALLVLLLLVAALSAAIAIVGGPVLRTDGRLGRFTPTAPTLVEHGAGHTATALADGRVLIVGGDGAEDRAELFDPATRTFTASGPLDAARGAFTATLLPDGRVLIAGGFGGADDSGDMVQIPDAEVFDPASATFLATSSMVEPRSQASAVALADGRVLIAGGVGGADDHWLNTAELYDPTSGRFTPTGSMNAIVDAPMLVPLADGRVLALGGATEAEVEAGMPAAVAEAYDPATGIFTTVGSPHSSGAESVSVLLADGQVLLTGGSDFGTALASAELFDPRTGTFTPTGSLTTDRMGAGAARLPDGRVLVAGGWNRDGYPRTAEVYDPRTGEFEVAATMAAVHPSASVTLLQDGTVLVVGGAAAPETFALQGTSQPPGATDPEPSARAGGAASRATGEMVTKRSRHAATLLADGRVLIAGGLDRDDQPIARAELYDPRTETFSPTGSLRTPGYIVSAVSLPDGRVLVVSDGMMEAYDPVTGTFSTLGPIPGARTGKLRGTIGGSVLPDGRLLFSGGMQVEQVYDLARDLFESIPLPGDVGHARSALLLADGSVLVVEPEASDSYGNPVLRAFVLDPTDWSVIREFTSRAPGHGTLAVALPDGRALYLDGFDDQPAIIDPIAGTVTMAGPMAERRRGATATLLGNDRVLVAGGDEASLLWDFPPALSSAELFDPRSGTSEPAGDMVARRSGQSATLLSDGRVLFAGGAWVSPDRTETAGPSAELYTPGD